MTREAGDKRPLPSRAAVRRRAGRRPILAGLLLSALAHVVVIVLYPFFSAVQPEFGVFPLLPDPPQAPGMRVLDIVELTGPVVEDPLDPTEIEDPVEPEIAPEAPGFEDQTIPLPERYRSAAERLRRGEGDPRLWAPLDPALVEPTPQQLLALRILAAVESSNDSAAAEAARLAEAMDWTYTDADGKRWGVSPGRVHLGDVEIPLGNFGFGPPPDYNGDQAEWAFRMADIERAFGSLAARQSWRERLESMQRRREEQRARQEEERAKAAVRPDTTSGGTRRR